MVCAASGSTSPFRTRRDRPEMLQGSSPKNPLFLTTARRRCGAGCEGGRATTRVRRPKEGWPWSLPVLYFSRRWYPMEAAGEPAAAGWGRAAGTAAGPGDKAATAWALPSEGGQRRPGLYGRSSPAMRGPLAPGGPAAPASGGGSCREKGRGRPGPPVIPPPPPGPVLCGGGTQRRAQVAEGRFEEGTARRGGRRGAEVPA